MLAAPGRLDGVLDVRQSRELQAAVLALKQAERTIVRDINKDAKAKLTPIWTAGLSRKATRPLERRGLVPGARLTTTAGRVRASAATSNRRLSGGLIPSIDYGPLEWGAQRRKRTVQGRSRRGNPYRYARMVNGQFRTWTRTGHVAMAVAGDVIGEAVVIWLEVIVSKFRENFDVKAGV